MGVKALRKIQLGDESVAGTAVAAAVIWRGSGVMSDDREVVFVDADVGYLGGLNDTYIPKYEASISFEPVEATYEQLPLILEAGIETETQTAEGSGFLYTYNFPTTGQRTPRTFTIEAGDDTQAEEMEYAFVRSFTIASNADEAVMMSADWVGRQVTNTTFTGALSIPTVEDILGGNTELYIDGTGTYPATTQLTATLHSWTLNVSDTGHKPKYLGDGNLYFTTNFQDMPDVTLDLVMAHVSNATTEKTNWRNETARAVRLQVDGTALSTAGGTYSNKTLIIDLLGTWENFDVMEDIDGNNTVTATLRAKYDTTNSAMGRVIVVTEDAITL